MEVPDNWWPAFSGQALNTGRIAGVDFDIEIENHFQLELDNYTMMLLSALQMSCISPSLCFAFLLMLSVIQWMMLWRSRWLMMMMTMTMLL
jgi:hypothetical protein